MTFRCLLPSFVFALTSALGATAPVFNIRDHGAVGDGRTLDTAAINRAIAAATEAGGGTVWFPAGTYLSYSIRLQSKITLHLDAGATLLAADPPAEGETGYDLAEPNVWGDEHQYQDFGHSHWRNSLIWGIGLHDIAITGTGTIDGRGLVGARPFLWPHEQEATAAAAGPGTEEATRARRSLWREDRPGNGDKAIALKSCRNVTLRDFTSSAAAISRCSPPALTT